MILVLIIAVVVAALVTMLWLVTRQPDLKRRAVAAEAQVTALAALVRDVRTYAIAQADADPVAQVIVDMIGSATRPIIAAGEEPARSRLQEK